MSSTENTAGAHEAQIILPGSFVVLQGMDGDGLWNTMDSVPVLEEDFQHVEAEQVLDYDASPDAQPQAPLARSPMSTLPHNMAHATNMPPLSLNPLHPQSNESHSRREHDSSASEEAFIVVPPERQEARTRAEEQALEAWDVACRSREQRHRADFLNSQQQGTPHEEEWWMTHDKRLAILRELPSKDSSGNVKVRITGSLAPGSTVVGSQLVYLDSSTLSKVPFAQDQQRHTKGVSGQVQVLKLESPQAGYVAFSVDGYCFLGPGLPSLYMDPQVWIWRVVAKAGAFVRQGLDLTSTHVATLPYGSFLRVTQKTINTMGLARLYGHAFMEGVAVEGWLSESLNPLSGHTGPIVQPVPFPVPALYRVTLSEGAVIRSNVELSSPVIARASRGAVLQVVGRQFSATPQDQCIERLKLAGNGGFVSVRLNKPPPENLLLFEFVGIDGTFDPENPGLYHLDAQRRVQQQVDNTTTEGEAVINGDISSIDEDHLSAHSSPASSNSSRVVTRSGVAGPTRKGFSEGHCLICLTEERTATIVHGETGHIACCIVCARILKARGDRCPVCRLKIDSVIQQFWA